MADNSSYANGVKRRFQSCFRNWRSSNDTRPELRVNSDLSAGTNPHRYHVCRPVIIGSDGRVRPAILECPPKHNHKETSTTTKENAYRVQPASLHWKEHVPEERKMDFSRGLPEPSLITEGGWVRPSPNGWKLPPEVPLEKVTYNFDTATEYSRGSAEPTSGIGWARKGHAGPVSTTSIGQWDSTGVHSNFDEKRTTIIIDSREAAKKYGGKFTW